MLVFDSVAALKSGPELKIPQFKISRETFSSGPGFESRPPALSAGALPLSYPSTYHKPDPILGSAHKAGGLQNPSLGTNFSLKHIMVT